MSASDIIHAKEETIAYLARVHLPSKHRTRILEAAERKFNIWIFALGGLSSTEELV